MTFSFALMHAGMIGGITPNDPAQWPSWLSPLYQDEAAHLGPVVADMRAAEQSGQAGGLRGLLDAMTPRLHVSFIDTGLPLTKLVQHLRQFAFFNMEDGNYYALSLADCRILPELARIFTPLQWGALTHPFSRWQIHLRHGELAVLPSQSADQTAATTPLTLSNAQIDALVDAAEADHLIGNLTQATSNALPGNAADHYRWAQAAISAWQRAGQADRTVLAALTAAMFRTRGKLFEQIESGSLLAGSDGEAICQALGNT